MNRLRLREIGPIHDADVELGHLTVLVGPQASGKSIFLQWLALLKDAQYVRSRLRQYGIDWRPPLPNLIETYFGEGSGSMWRDGSDASGIWLDGWPIGSPETRLTRGGSRQGQTVFYIPAQRAGIMRDGWPLPFQAFGAEVPFSVRDFSDRLRVLLGWITSADGELFPRSNKLKAPLRRALDEAVFRGFGLRVDRTRPQRRLLLAADSESPGLPYMTWSAGQREFVPLLLGLYWLMPAARVSRRSGVEWVVIEEPEMGLHPQAIGAAMLLVMELLWRGYRVCLSTHSPHVLDILWGLRVVQERGQPGDVADMLGVPRSGPVATIAESALQCTRRVYFFSTEGESHDISQLDPASDTPHERGWGGLTGFSERVGDVVARLAR